MQYLAFKFQHEETSLLSPSPSAYVKGAWAQYESPLQDDLSYVNLYVYGHHDQYALYGLDFFTRDSDDGLQK